MENVASSLLHATRDKLHTACEAAASALHLKNPPPPSSCSAGDLTAGTTQYCTWGEGKESDDDAIEESDDGVPYTGDNHHSGHSPDLQHKKVPEELRQSFKKPYLSQRYSLPIDRSINVEPTAEELVHISAACSRLWELDLNRLTPGLDYELNYGWQNSKWRSRRGRLFSRVNGNVFEKPTYARFYALLDNYNRHLRKAEKRIDEYKDEERAFMKEISESAPIQYLYKYLVAKGGHDWRDQEEFEKELHSLWFGLFDRCGKCGKDDSSAFEHVFVGEIEAWCCKKPHREVTGFHNWIKFYTEEDADRLKFEGFIPSNHSKPNGNSPCLTIKFRWDRFRKEIATMFVGVSPEFELALYTMCFYGGQKEYKVKLGDHHLNILCFRYNAKRIKSCYPQEPNE